MTFNTILLMALVTLFSLFWFSTTANASEEEIANLQARVYQLEQENKRQSSKIETVEEIAKKSAPLLFLFGAFCALWAQNNRRNAWGWFFLGAIFSVFAVLFVLSLNKEPPEHSS